MDLEDIDITGGKPLFDRLVFDQWLQSVNGLYDLLYQQRRAELKPGGAHNRGWTTDGFHELSVLWGRMLAYEHLLPELVALDANIKTIRGEAVRDAEEHALMATRLGLVLQGAA